MTTWNSGTRAFRFAVRENLLQACQGQIVSYMVHNARVEDSPHIKYKTSAVSDSSFRDSSFKEKLFMLTIRMYRVALTGWIHWSLHHLYRCQYFLNSGTAIPKLWWLINQLRVFKCKWYACKKVGFSFKQSHENRMHPAPATGVSIHNRYTGCRNISRSILIQRYFQKAVMYSSSSDCFHSSGRLALACHNKKHRIEERPAYHPGSRWSERCYHL